MKNYILLVAFSLIFSISNAQLQDNYDISTSANGIIAMPYTQGVFSSFVKYTKIQAPNGKAIHFIAQNAITDAQIVRARNILTFYLTNYAGSQYGNDKTAVINAMGTNNSILMLLNGSDNGNPPNIQGQPLYQNEMAVEGHAWYINNNYSHRDASFEEILHFMHDNGIGVDNNGTPSPTGALPAYQTEIRAAQNNADNNNFAIWPIGSNPTSGWYFELKQENSLSQEYLASVVDSYYGLWEAWNDSGEPASATTGMWGLYIAKTRAEIQTEDPMGYALMPKYFSPYININFDIDPSFSGIFNMNYTASQPYTFKSQYLQHLSLTGNNASGIKGNDLDNNLIGNNANNTLEGGKGNDTINGKGGIDTAIFTGNKSEYTITQHSDHITVKDNTTGRDGTDQVYSCEGLKFADQNQAGTTGDGNNPNVSINELGKENFMQIKPNPAQHFIHIHLTKANDYKLLISDLTGKILSKKTFKTATYSLDISNLAKGIYFATVKTKDNRLATTQKIIVQ